jgi:hypothetical protein
VTKGKSTVPVGTSILLGGLCLFGAVSLFAADRVTFVGVALDQETREADRRLQDYLQRSADIRFAPEELEYGQVIERLADWDPAGGVVIARTTPYVQVVAEMLGADLEILATYVSEITGQTTYHSYYVVRKEDLPPNPTPADVISYVAAAPDRVRFTHHSLFSTSSFFLPSLNFRANGVFHMAESTESLAAIQVTRADVSSSSHLVRAVARGEADLAGYLTAPAPVSPTVQQVPTMPRWEGRWHSYGCHPPSPTISWWRSAPCRRRRSPSATSLAGSTSVTRRRLVPPSPTSGGWPASRWHR